MLDKGWVKGDTSEREEVKEEEGYGEGLLGSLLGAHTTQCHPVATWQRGGNVHGHEHGHGHSNPATGRATIVTLLRGLAQATALAPLVESGANILRNSLPLKRETRQQH